MMVEVGLQLISQMVFIPLVDKCLVNIEKAFGKILGLRQNFNVMGKA